MVAVDLAVETFDLQWRSAQGYGDRRPLQLGMDPLIHTRDQETVETVDFDRLICFVKDEECLMCRQNNMHRFLGLTRFDLYCLPRNMQNVRLY